MSGGGRMLRVNELVREVVADAVQELKDPRLGFVTVTGVSAAPDLRTAVVYYSVLGDEAQRASTASALASAAARLQRAVGRETRLKFTPKLRFEIDPAIGHGDRIEQVLRELGAEGEAEPA